MHILSMEINDTHGPRHLYWANENELFPNMKNISNPTSKIAIDLELNWGKDIISGKDDVPEYGANNILPNHVMALTDVIAGSWFDFVKYEFKLKGQGLCSIIHVKRAHKEFDCQLVSEEPFQGGGVNHCR